MTTRQFERIGRAVAEYLPQFRVKGYLTYEPPLNSVLRGLCFSGSGDKHAFYVHAFAQPLFVPAPTVVLNIGWRLGGPGHSWSIGEPGLIDRLCEVVQNDVVPFVERVRSPAGLMEFARGLGRQNDVFVMRTVAYSHVWLGIVDHAVRELD